MKKPEMSTLPTKTLELSSSPSSRPHVNAPLDFFSMYISIEGIKGTGKSTLIEELQKYFLKSGISFELLAPTRRIPGHSAIEEYYASVGDLKHQDLIKEWVYANRSNHAALSLKGNTDLILGDRSIVTSYVTRWNKWGSREACIDRVDTLEPFIPSPDHILYLDASLEEVIRRVESRKDRTYGHEDETRERLQEARDAYQEIMENPIPRISKSRWHVINADESPEVVLNTCIDTIKTILQLPFVA